MTLTPEELTSLSQKINIVWDATILDTFQSCPAKFNYRFNLLREAVDKPPALDTGSLVHIGHEAYYNQLKEDGNWEKAVEKSLLAVRIAPTELQSEEVSRVLDVLEETHTVWRFKDLSYEILAVEQPFSYVLKEDEQFRVIMIGKIDLLVNDYPHYMNLPIDHKSYTRDGPVKRKTNQFTNYSYAMQSPFLVVNRVGLSESIGVGAKRTTDPAARHKRIPLSYDPLYYEQWKENVWHWAMLYYDAHQTGVWPLNDTSCDKFNRLCEYYEVCDTSGENNKIYKLETDFKLGEKWDVSSSLAKKG